MFSWITRAFNWAVGKVDNVTAGWVYDILNVLWGFLHGLFSGIIDAWNDFYDAVKSAATGLAYFASQMWHFINWLFDVWWHGIWTFIVHEIWNPLKLAWDWIRKEGAYMYHLLTHAVDLVEFFWDALIAKLESDAWNVSQKLGSFALALVINNLDRFTSLIEDILDAIL